MVKGSGRNSSRSVRQERDVLHLRVKAGEGLFIRGCDDRTRRNSFYRTEGRFRIDIRGKIFTETAVRQCHSCPEALTARQDRAPGSFIWREASLPMAGAGTGRAAGSLQHKPSGDPRSTS